MRHELSGYLEIDKDSSSFVVDIDPIKFEKDPYLFHSFSPDIIVQELLWLIMDINENLIARGTTKNRYLTLRDTPDSNRVLTYMSQSWAEQGYAEGKFKLHKQGVEQYIIETYNVNAREFLENREIYLKAVEAEMTIQRW